MSIIIPKDLREEMEKLAKLTNEDRSTIVRRLVTRGLDEVKLDLAIDYYLKGKVSFGKAAEIGGVSIWRLIDGLRDRRVASRYSIEDAEEDIRRVTKAFLDAGDTE